MTVQYSAQSGRGCNIDSNFQTLNIKLTATQLFSVKITTYYRLRQQFSHPIDIRGRFLASSARVKAPPVSFVLCNEIDKFSESKFMMSLFASLISITPPPPSCKSCRGCSVWNQHYNHFCWFHNWNLHQWERDRVTERDNVYNVLNRQTDKHYF